VKAQGTKSGVLETFLRSVNRRLADRYGTPDLGNVREVFGEIIFALLSTRSAPLNYRKAFATLRERFPDWTELAGADVDEVGRLIQACGLHNRKAKAIVAIANKVFAEQGMKDLEHLRRMTTDEAEAYLTALPEVGIKVAKCVCLYSLDRAVFPLDVHNLRVLKRLGVVEERATAREWAERVEDLIPPEIRHELHVNLVAHGRETCTAKPSCGKCVLLDVCPYPKQQGLVNAI
jgi:endonuclease-3